MKNQALLITFLLGPFLMGNSYAEDCSKLGSEIEMNQCVTHEYTQLDGQLNKIYSQYRARLNSIQKKQLMGAQSAWLKYRDLSCDFEASGVKGGSAYTMVRTQCLLQKARVRFGEIKILFTCEEGDLSCLSWK